MYTSVTKNFRGFHYSGDWDTHNNWSDEMRKQELKDSEVDWSILIHIASGLPVMKYSRGYGTRKLEVRDEF